MNKSVLLLALSAVCATSAHAQRFQCMNESQGTRNVAIQGRTMTVVKLDEFASRCGAVAYDDGTSEGRPAGEDGQHEATEKIPRFVPLDIDVDWKVLPKGLMYDAMSLPQKQLEINQRLAVIADHPDPPDHPEYFLTRQLEYAKLGIHVSQLSARLRAHAGLPLYEAGPDSWDRDTELPSRVREITQESERRRRPSPA